MYPFATFALNDLSFSGSSSDNSSSFSESAPIHPSQPVQDDSNVPWIFSWSTGWIVHFLRTRVLGVCCGLPDCMHAPADVRTITHVWTALKRLLSLLAHFCAEFHLGCSKLVGDDSGRISLPQQWTRIGYVASDKSKHGLFDLVCSFGAVGSSLLSGILIVTGAQCTGKDTVIKLKWPMLHIRLLTSNRYLTCVEF